MENDSAGRGKTTDLGYQSTKRLEVTHKKSHSGVLQPPFESTWDGSSKGSTPWGFMSLRNRDRPQSASLGRNLRCLICLDGCKTKCSCAPGYSLRDTLRYTSLWLTAPVNQAHTGVVGLRPTPRWPPSRRDPRSFGAERAASAIRRAVGPAVATRARRCALPWCIPTRAPRWIVRCDMSP